MMKFTKEKRVVNTKVGAIRGDGMENIWNFYENMNEIVYVTDIETRNVVYLNRKAREVYGIKSLEDLKEKKCYKMFWGQKNPCTYCKIDKLCPGYFDEWRYADSEQNRVYMIKDTRLDIDGRRYHMGITIDCSGQARTEDINDFIDREVLLNEALRVSLICDYPEESINTLLEYLGIMLQCDRIYIFENRFDGYYENTYEWCAKGVTPQIENLKDFPEQDLRIWLDRFESGSNIMIDKLEDIKETDPVMYDYLLPQEIDSLVVGPLSFQNKNIGFFGVDNPPEQLMKNISNLFMIMGHFIVSLLRRRDLFLGLEHLSFYDKLTGLGNRHRMDDCIDKLNMEQSIGIVNCDVMGLKVVNDSQGHQAGDDLLVRASNSLKKAFPNKYLFRTGGDEFLALCPGIAKADFEERIRILDAEMHEQSALMAYGSVWRENAGGDINALLTEADERMYEKKRAYYAEKKRDRRS